MLLLLHVQMPAASRVPIPASPVSGKADQIAAAAAVTMFMHAAAPAQLEPVVLGKLRHVARPTQQRRWQLAGGPAPSTYACDWRSAALPALQMCLARTVSLCAGRESQILQSTQYLNCCVQKRGYYNMRFLGRETFDFGSSIGQSISGRG